MKYKPHEYQQFTTTFIEQHPQAAIFLGMGMGKTISTLTAINDLIYDSFDVTKALIVAPLRVARDTWPAEIRKWDHLANLRYATILGTPAQRRAALDQDADLYIINRENIPWLVDELGKTWPFDMVVIDEMSSFKNHKAARFKKLNSRRKNITRLVGLTGTPAPNSLLDLWAQFRLLDGGQRLGKFIGHYRDRYFLPDKRNGQQIFTWKLKPGADEDIYRRIQDITVSMRTTDYLDLPKCTAVDYVVHLNKKERAAYEKLQAEMVIELADGDAIDAPTAAALTGKLLQFSSGAVYTDEKAILPIHDRKLDALAAIIDEAEGQSVLVAYWFKHERPRILKRLPGAVALNSAEDFDRWSRGEIPVGLIHPSSAGHGLNLQTGGHILVWTTTPYSLELYEQTNARLYRQGQTEPVTIIHIVTAETIDSAVAAALVRKDNMQSALIDAVKAELERT